MSVIERLEKRLKIAKEGIAIMELDARYQNGVKDGFASAINELKADSPVMDSRFEEIQSHDTIKRGCDIWVRQETYRARCEQLEEAITFIDNIVKAWGRSFDRVVSGQGIYGIDSKEHALSFEGKARGIINRAKEAQYETGTDDDEFDTDNTD